MFEKFARRCSRRHKQTTFPDAVFLGILRVKKGNNRYLPSVGNGPVQKVEIEEPTVHLWVNQYAQIENQ